MCVGQTGDDVTMAELARFVFMTCQVGAEPALKAEIARDWPGLRFAYSRPGFVTFKHSTGAEFSDDFHTHAVFARSTGVSLGKVTQGTPEERARQVWQMLADRPIADLHVFPRDKFEPGFRDYEPGLTDESRGIDTLLRSVPEAPRAVAARQAPPPPDPKTGPLVADVVLVEPEEWWIGCHRARRPVSAWPGGLLPLELPVTAVSRVYLKMHESLLWSGFKMLPGQTVVELGSAPGGASQALLERELLVVGIDPAEMDAMVLSHPGFRHVRKRSKDVPRREFQRADWLTCDINLPPNYTLDTVEAIVKAPGVRLKGVIMNLKLVDWKLAESIPEYLQRVQSWGFRQVRARQLHHNRQEICVVAK